MSLPILQNSRSGLIGSRLVETDVDAAATVNNNAEIWCKKKLQIVSYMYSTFMNRIPETQRGQRLCFQRRPIREKASEKPVFSLSLWMYRRPNRYAQLKTRRTYTAPIDMRVGGTTDIARDRSTNGWTCFRLSLRDEKILTGLMAVQQNAKETGKAETRVKSASGI